MVDPNGEAEDPSENPVVGGFEKENGDVVDCEEAEDEEAEDPNWKPDMVSLSLSLSLCFAVGASLLWWVWASDLGF